MSIYRRRLMMKDSAMLPDDYQRVEFLQSTGTQWIDTGINFDSSTDYEFEAYIDETNTNGSAKVFCGARTNAGSNDRCCLFITDGNLPRFDLGFESSSGLYFPKNTFSNKRSVFRKQEKQLLINDQKIVESGTVNNLCKYTMYIFALNTSGTAGAFSNNLKIYYFKIYQSNTLIGSFVPCYRKSDHKAGMYDTVTRKFLTNAGSGEFVLGGDV